MSSQPKQPTTPEKSENPEVKSSKSEMETDSMKKDFLAHHPENLPICGNGGEDMKDSQSLLGHRLSSNQNESIPQGLLTMPRNNLASSSITLNSGVSDNQKETQIEGILSEPDSSYISPSISRKVVSQSADQNSSTIGVKTAVGTSHRPPSDFSGPSNHTETGPGSLHSITNEKPPRPITRKNPVIRGSSSDSSLVSGQPNCFVAPKTKEKGKTNPDLSNLNGNLMKNIDCLKTLLCSCNLIDFPDNVLSSLCEIHELTSIATLVADNRKAQKYLNLSDEIFWECLQNQINLTHLKLHPEDPEYNLEVITHVASFKQNAKYVAVTEQTGNDFACKACYVNLSPYDLEQHFSGAKHRRILSGINKTINPALTDIINQMCHKISVDKCCINAFPSNKPMVSGTVTNLPNSSSPLKGKLSTSSSKESMKSSSGTSEVLSIDDEVFSQFQSISPFENFCKVCKTRVTGPLSASNPNLEQHVRGTRHTSKVQVNKAKVKSTSANATGPPEQNNGSKSLSNDEMSQSPVHTKATSNSVSPSEKIEELMSYVMKKHLKGEVNESNKMGCLGFYCYICDKVVTNDAQWMLHLDKYSHKRKVLLSPGQTGLYHCVICQIAIFCPLVMKSHDHIFSNEHICIKKLVEKKCPDIWKHIQLNKVLIIKFNKVSTISLCLNSDEDFPFKDVEPVSAESKNISKPNSANANSPVWILPQNSPAKRKEPVKTRKSIRLDSSEESEDSSSEEDFMEEYFRTDSESSDDDYEDNDEDRPKRLSTGVKGRTAEKDKAQESRKEKKGGAGDAEQARKREKNRGKKKEKPGCSVTFTGIDDSVSNDEWCNRFSEVGRLKNITIDYSEHTATVVFVKRSAVRTLLGNKAVFLNKYNLQATETGQKKLDNTCLELFENEHEFVNKILLTLSVIDDELKSSEANMRLSCLKESILQAIRPNFPDCKIYEFGSRVSGLATDESDYDLFLDLTGKMYQGTKPAVDHETRLEMIKAIRKIAKVFQQMPDDFTNIVPITSARVPILKFKHIKTDSPCDLSFKNGLSVENTKLVRKYLNMNPKVRWLVIAVKRWAVTCDLLSSSHFTTYAITWLVLFFLMSKKLVPSVGSLMNQKNRNKPLIQGWRCNFDESKSSRDLEESNVKLLLDFFDFYENFDFTRNVICTRSGTQIRKFVMLERKVSMMPIEIKEDYCSSVCKSDRDRDFSVSTCSVQDPFDLSHNITKQVRPGKLRSFKRFCQLAQSQIRKWPPFQV